MTFRSLSRRIKRRKYLFAIVPSAASVWAQSYMPEGSWDQAFNHAFLVNIILGSAVIGGIAAWHIAKEVWK